MRKPAKTPAMQHETIPVSEIPQAVLVKAIFSRKPHAAPKRQVPLAEKKIKVMIVDDDTSIAEAFARLLDAFGYECYAVYNAADALACAESFMPDVVLSDVIMQGMNGVELCQEIRHMLPKCRILLMSGQVPTAHSLMQDAGGSAATTSNWWAKPVRPQELVAKIEACSAGAYAGENIKTNQGLGALMDGLNKENNAENNAFRAAPLERTSDESKTASEISSEKAYEASRQARPKKMEEEGVFYPPSAKDALTLD